MRKTTVRRGIRAISAGIAALIAATFFHNELAIFLMLGMDGEARLTFFGFFLAGMLGGFGALVAALGFLQSGSGQPRVRLLPAVVMLFSLVVLFFVLTYTSFTSPPLPVLEKGESIDI
jgi:putative flippase GtrA